MMTINEQVRSNPWRTIEEVLMIRADRYVREHVGIGDYNSVERNVWLNSEMNFYSVIWADLFEKIEKLLKKIRGKQGKSRKRDLLKNKM